MQSDEVDSSRMVINISNKQTSYLCFLCILCTQVLSVCYSICSNTVKYGLCIVIVESLTLPRLLIITVVAVVVVYLCTENSRHVESEDVVYSC